jgi:inorganic pyrophosphatase
MSAASSTSASSASVPPEQTEDGETERNDPLLGVALHSYDHQDLNNLSDANPTMLKQVEEFFVTYNKQRGKKFRVTGSGGPRRAIEFLEKGIRDFRTAKKKKKRRK